MIIFRYLTRQILQAMLALSFILLVVAVLGRLLNYLAEASQGELDPSVLLLLMSYRLPDFLQLILPLGLLLGILLAYGRMYAESEMTVLAACGISTRRLLGLSTFSGALVMLLVAFLSLYLTPLSLVQTARLLESQQNLNEFDVMVPGLFQNISGGQRTTYAESVSPDGMSYVLMHESNGDRLILAESARPYEDAEGRRFVLFKNGSMAEGLSGAGEYSLTRFEEWGVSLPPRDLNFDVALEEKAMSNAELWNAGQPLQIAELQWRISLVLLVPVLMLLAVPLSRVSPREGRFGKLVPAILLYLAYFGLLLVCRDLVASGTLPPWLGLWWVHLVFAGLGLWLMGGWQGLRGND
ncbi:MAG: LPS export ABC transporter permease LptF [Pseudomonadales bacterium]|jgi:lipopolysaccharide export system permease protein|nr:LPS export ABC transporter permease LptF [Pseudomonadales bacterium]